jgi:hypothetical protein
MRYVDIIPPLPNLHVLSLSREPLYPGSHLPSICQELHSPVLILPAARHSLEKRLDLSREVQRACGLFPRISDLVVQCWRFGHSPEEPYLRIPLGVDLDHIYLLFDEGKQLYGSLLDEIAHLTLNYPGDLSLHCNLTWNGLFEGTKNDNAWESTLGIVHARLASQNTSLGPQADICLLLTTRLLFAIPDLSIETILDDATEELTSVRCPTTVGRRPSYILPSWI